MVRFDATNYRSKARALTYFPIIRDRYSPVIVRLKGLNLTHLNNKIMFKYKSNFCSFSVNNLKKAIEFYNGVLGIAYSEDEQQTINLHLLKGSNVLLYEKSNHVPATFTVLNFIVENIDTSINELTLKGIQFEMFSTNDIQTNDKGFMRGNGPTIAWFKDPFGNFLSIIEMQS
jgi:predicted enzyme related to lactoylglutathione lyase